ncbi:MULTISPECIES: GAD-like domain-containing protein [unclassified Pseudomonas]|uniref:GAD-like domain-containing protein n=1 Tax=unclassified Pseudomonas TaxID=196821 RepID=UPI000D34C642|nr:MULTISPECIES: GAD-like domain-containing protein [unclassified Pseudomonas]RAU46406.1 DUF1851 domain-containing protein [Pseudomonas sp. RIT 409]RAU52583.1 DUF1851 domain-containing protein [Pseudomonas sp. RIT 412]
MNEYFSYFLNNMGPDIHRREAPATSIECYRGDLPDLLLEFWGENGWSGYGDGIFWTVNPADYDATVRTWLEASGIQDADTYHVVARSAFGDLYLWQSRTGSTLNIDSVYARYSLSARPLMSKAEANHHVEVFFMNKDRDTDDFDDLFTAALKKLGRLEPDEMYGFVPALVLGGPSDPDHLQKVKIVEHLTFLSQLSPLRDWGFPNLDSL